jgi:hypothetical protein
MPTLPRVLTPTDLPWPELQAARLDGELYALDTCFIPIDEPELPSLRAESIAVTWPDRLIAEQHSAAWVLGATDTKPHVHELCADIGARSRPVTTIRASIREVVIDASEIVRVGRLDVTSPIRTAIDLARFAVLWGEEERRIRDGLMARWAFDVEDCRAVMDARRNLPGKRMALERLLG